MMSFYSEQHIKHSRKAHTCSLCGKEIPVGDPYVRETGKYDGDFFNRTVHTHCHYMEVQFCSEVDSEFTWDDILDYFVYEYCDTCPHSWQNDYLPNYVECPYDMCVTDCLKIREELMS